MTNINSRDRRDPSREILQENIAMREQNIAMREQNRAIRENDSAATGLMLGILLFGIAALGFAVYFISQKPTITPARTIIEREKTNVVPAPSTAPNVNVTVPNPAPPNVNITVPDSAPAAQPSPSATLAPPNNAAPSNSSSSSAPQTAPANP